MSTNLPLNLLAEETTIDPTDPFPSFYEIKLLEGTSLAGEKAIHTSVQAIIDRLLRYLYHDGPTTSSTRQESSYRQRIARFCYKPCRNHQAEIECLVSFIIHCKTLASPSFASTLSESFYSLKRSRVTKDGRLETLTKSDGIKAALWLAIGPYIQHRLDALYQSIRLRASPNTTRGNKIQKMQQLFVYLYPLLHMSHHGIKLAYQFVYLIGKTRYFDPHLHVLGQIVRRITLEDVKTNPSTQQHKNDKSTTATATAAHRSSQQEIVLLKLKKVAMVGIASALILGWMGKLRQEIQKRRRLWWIQNQDSSSMTATDQGWIRISSSSNKNNATNDPNYDDVNETVVIPAPPPPPPRQPTTMTHKKGKFAVGTVSPNQDFQKCPICHETRINPTASSSGYVFCFKCLVLHIRKYGPKCPVTGLPCQESQIVRLYEPSQVKR